MKNLLLFFLLFGTSILCTSCNNDDTEDLTVEIVGNYIGTFGSNTIGNINPFEITVARIADNIVSINPSSSSEFDEFEVELERSNSSTINSPTDANQQLEVSVIFTESIPIIVNILIDPTGDAQAFTGEKQ